MIKKKALFSDPITHYVTGFNVAITLCERRMKKGGKSTNLAM